MKFNGEGHDGRLGKIDRPEYVGLRTALADAMTKRGISQRQLSEQLGKPHVFVNRILQGRRSIEWSELIDICDCIGVSVREIVDSALERSGR